MSTTTSDPNHLYELQPRSCISPSAAQSAFEPRTLPHLDLRIVAFMLVVAAVQLLTFKRPFS